ncbi:hypothetical protein FY048_17790 [Acinetobacter sp. 1124_18A]|uniref:hypothetical protein n=1 Tax=Acinetobacter sp. 1124_18A TaxID=2605958 RepID=UPI004059A214
MKRVQHLTPILNIVFKGNIFYVSRVNGRELIWLNRCAEMLPELYWDFSLDFPFNPKSIHKVKNRKLRRACYQSFALYKKTFKPGSTKKLKIFKYEWPSLDKWKASMLEATETAAKRFSDTADAMSYAFNSLEKFRTNYLCSWDLAAGVE